MQMHFKTSTELRSIYRHLLRQTTYIFDDALRFYYAQRIAHQFKLRVKYYQDAYDFLCKDTYSKILSTRAMIQRNRQVDLTKSAEERLEFLANHMHKKAEYEQMMIFPLPFSELHYEYYRRDLIVIDKFNEFLTKLLNQEPKTVQIAVEYAYGVSGFVKKQVENARRTYLFAPYLHRRNQLVSQFHPIHILFITGLTMEELNAQSGTVHDIPLSHLCISHSYLRYRQMLYDRVWPLPAELRKAYTSVVRVPVTRFNPLYNHQRNFAKSIPQLPENDDSNFTIPTYLPANYVPSAEKSTDRLTADEIYEDKWQENPSFKMFTAVTPKPPIMSRSFS